MNGRPLLATLTPQLAAELRIALLAYAHAVRQRGSRPSPDFDLFASWIAAEAEGRPPVPAEPSGWLSIGQAAEQLGVSERTIRRRVADGSLAHRRIGRRVLISRAATSGHQRSGADTGGDTGRPVRHGHPNDAETT